MKFGLWLWREPIHTFLSGVLLASLIVGFLCISFVYSIPVHADTGEMHTMHHADQAATLDGCCETGASDHMEVWKSTFLGVPQVFQDILALIVISVIAFGFSDFFTTPRLSENLLSTRFRQYAREHPDIPTYNSLRLAFARGILHPKTY